MNKIIDKYIELLRHQKGNYRSEQGKITALHLYGFLAKKTFDINSVNPDKVRELSEFLHDLYRVENDWKIRGTYVKVAINLASHQNAAVLDQIVREFVSNATFESFSEFTQVELNEIVTTYPSEYSINASKDLDIFYKGIKFIPKEVENIFVDNLIQKFVESNIENKANYANALFKLSIKDPTQKIKFFDELIKTKEQTPEIVKQAIKLRFFDIDQNKQLKNKANNL